MRKRLITILIMLPVIMFFSCSKNYRELLKEPEKKFYQGQYKKAADMLKPLAMKKDKNQLLYMMEAGYMFHAAKDYNTSNRILIEAGKIAKFKPISVTKQAASFLTNESATNYRGEDFEKVLIHMYAGLNFIMLKNYDAARVEFTAVNEGLAKIRLENGKAKYRQNIMAKYLTAIAYEISADLENDQNDLEFAYIEYKQIFSLAPNLNMIKNDLLRTAKKLKYMDDYAMWAQKFGVKDNTPDDAGEVVVVYEAGRGAIKKSRGSLLSDVTIKANINATLRNIPLKEGVTIAAVLISLRNAENPIPRFVKRSNITRYINVSTDGISQPTTMLEDIEQTAVKTLKDDYTRLRLRVAGQIVTKAVASLAAGYAAKKAAEKIGGKAKAFSGLIGTLAGAGTGAALFSQMKPDLRCWHTLPANLQLSRIFLKPGKYNIKLDYINSQGNVQTSKQIPVEVKKGRRVFINERTLR